MESFRKLGLSEPLIKALKEAGFKEPSEIQEKVMPLAVAGHDIIGSAQTGSGKTLAFGGHILDMVHNNPSRGVKALIVTPTRELAEQIARSLDHFARYMNVGLAAIYGGVSYGPQIDMLRRADIIVGTPGRLLDHIHERTFDTSHIKVLVLDEADRMLDMGFIEDVTEIIESCPKERQTLLLSATMSADIDHMAERYMKEPKRIEAGAQVDPSKLKQIFYDVPQDMKFSLLVHLLRHEKQQLVMVFCNTRRNAELIVKNLKRYDINALAIHGGLSQNRRNNTLDQFHAQNIRVLVCTDVAARGLDIKGVSHVYNYDIPKTSKEYIHRIGRTARAGAEGIAINIVSRYDYANFREVMSDDSINIQLVDMPEVEQVSISFKDGAGRGDRRGGRNFGGRGGGRGYSRGRGGDRGSGRGYGRRERRY